MKSLLAALSFIFALPALAQEPCLIVVPVESVNEFTCGQVRVGVSKVDCERQTFVKDLGVQTGTVSCEGNPKTIHTVQDGFELISELRVANIWGDSTNLQVSSTISRPLAAHKKTPLARVEKSKPKKVAARPSPKEFQFKLSGFSWVGLQSSKYFGFTTESQYAGSNFFSNAHFKLGSYFSDTATADLFATRIKFNF